MFNKKFVDFVRETASYTVVGIISTLSSLFLQFVFTTLCHLEYTPSSILSFTISSPIAFLLNRRFTFRVTDIPFRKTLIKYYLTVVPVFILSYLVLKPGFDLLVPALNLPWPERYQTYTKQVLANGTYIVINYLGQKFFAFRKKTEPAQETEEQQDLGEQEVQGS